MLWNELSKKLLNELSTKLSGEVSDELSGELSDELSNELSRGRGYVARCQFLPAKRQGRVSAPASLAKRFLLVDKHETQTVRVV